MPLAYIPSHKVSEFKGLLTEEKDLRDVPDGYTPDARNWLTLTNNGGIELRRGTALLGTNRVAGVGRITGLGVGTRIDGREVPFLTRINLGGNGHEAAYYDSENDLVVPCDSQEPFQETPADDEFSIFPYQNLAGAWVYMSSPHSDIFKVPTANPMSVNPQASADYRGFLKFGQSRSFLFNRHGTTSSNQDLTSLYVSKVDKVDLSQYAAQTTGENVGTGDGSTTSFSGTLAQINTSKRTAMFVEITDTNETFIDDRNGNLVGTGGGSGSINYATGGFSVQFASAPVDMQAITASYYYEDATDGGVADFSIADPSDRQPGEGNVFPQFDGGGSLNSVFPLATVFYCYHRFKTWQVSIPTDDSSGGDSISINLPFREKMGVRSQYGAFGGEQGVYFMNTADPGKPEFTRLELFSGATESNIAQPKTLSDLIDLSSYAFDKNVTHEFENFLLSSVQQIRNGTADDFNSLTFVLNKKNAAWDLTDYPATRFATYEGGLLAGDPLSNNVFTLFSGFDDDGEPIPNYWTSGMSMLGIEGVKRFTRIVLEGLIQRSQRYKVQLSFDGGAWVDAAVVDGAGSYVDTSSSIAVGSYTVGSKIAGGGATVFANPYRAEFTVQSPRFTYVRIRFEASTLDENNNPGGGYVSINSYEFKDIRQKSTRSLPERTVTF